MSSRGWRLLDKILPIQQPVNDVLFDGLSREDFDAFARIVEIRCAPPDDGRPETVELVFEEVTG